MVSSNATTVDDYLASLPDDRRGSMSTVRDVIRANLPPGFEEGMQYGMIAWSVPLSRFPTTYNGQPLGLVALASQKRHLSLYLMSLHDDPEIAAFFEAGYRASGKELDMGTSCVRFQHADELPLDVIGQAIAKATVERVIAMHEQAQAQAKISRKKKKRKTPATSSKPAAG